MIEEPWLDGFIEVGGEMRGDPLEGEPVLDRNGKSVGLREEGVEVDVVAVVEGGFEEESAAVEVDQNGEFLGGVWDLGGNDEQRWRGCVR